MLSLPPLWVLCKFRAWAWSEGLTPPSTFRYWGQKWDFGDFLRCDNKIRITWQALGQSAPPLPPAHTQQGDVSTSVAHPSHPAPFESSPPQNMPTCIQPQSLFPKLINLSPLKENSCTVDIHHPRVNLAMRCIALCTPCRAGSVPVVFSESHFE